MSKTQKRTGSTHNPSPYMRRFQLPSLTFKDSSDYDELLSPLETESKQELMNEKNAQLRNYFSSSVSTRVALHETPSTSGFPGPKIDDSQVYEAPFEGNKISTRKVIPESRSFDRAIVKPKAEDIPPPVPPHRPHPRQKLLEIEKYRMCKEILELERRSREMYDILMSPPSKK